MHRQSASGGFTLLELLIVIAIIGILSAVLIPNLLNARARAFDTGAQACLKEAATAQELIAADFPFTYDSSFDPKSIATCAEVTFTPYPATVTDDDYAYVGKHARGMSTYTVSRGTSVTKVP
ncbi:hypothetical protein BH24DEI2_BH24DEI2_02630 [soil metagenome]